MSEDNDIFLHSTIFTKNLRLINKLFDDDVNINLNIGHRIPFYNAVASGDKKIIDFFLEKGVNVNVKDNAGDTVLHKVIKTRFPLSKAEVGSYLIKCGADVNAENKYKETPLFYAAKYDRSDMIEILLQSKLDTNLEGNKKAFMLFLKKPNSDPSISKALLKFGFTFNKTDTENVKLLYSIVKNNHAEALRILLNLGAEVETVVPFYYVRHTQYFTLLETAVIHQSLKTVQVLLRYGANVHAKYKNGPTALFFSANDHNIAEEILKQGVDVNAELIDGRTALHIAAESGNRELVDLLLKYKTNVNHKTKMGETPLHKATRSAMISMLIKHGADVNAKMHGNLTPLHSAVLRKHERSALNLLDHGADINAQDNYGRTPLHIAISKCCRHCVKHFYFHDADINIKDITGKLPYDVAVTNGNPDVYLSIDTAIFSAVSSSVCTINFLQLIPQTDLRRYRRPEENSIHHSDVDLNNSDSDSNWDYNNNSNNKIVKTIKSYQKFQESRRRIFNMSDEDIEALTISEDAEQKDKQVAKDVKLMRNTKVGEGIMLYDIVKKNYKEVARYMWDEKISFKIEPQKYELTYYSWLLKKQINAAEQYNMSKLAGQKLKIFFEKNLPDTVIHEILGYLSKIDVKNILSTKEDVDVKV